jgi:hypothetical protein
MSLSEDGIKGMLDEYEADYHTGMDTEEMAKLLRQYTSGYPYLVSRLCQLMDGAVGDRVGLTAAWTGQGMDEAIKIILADNKDPLFGSGDGEACKPATAQNTAARHPHERRCDRLAAGR